MELAKPGAARRAEAGTGSGIDVQCTSCDSARRADSAVMVGYNPSQNPGRSQHYYETNLLLAQRAIRLLVLP